MKRLSSFALVTVLLVLVVSVVRADDSQPGRLAPVEVTEEFSISGEIWQPSKHALFVEGSEKVVDIRTKSAFQRVDGDPAEKGQYRVDSAGTFHFHAQDKGRKVKVTYSYAPTVVILFLTNETGFPASIDDMMKALRAELEKRGYVPVARDKAQAAHLEVIADAKNDATKMEKMTVLDVQREVCKRVNAAFAVNVAVAAQSDSRYLGSITLQNNQSSLYG